MTDYPPSTPHSHSTVTGALNHIGTGRFQWWLLAYTGLAWAGDACETMVLSFLGPSVACAWPDTVTPFKESLLTSVVFGGMMVGVACLGAVSDALGRRKGFLLSATLLGGVGLISAAAPSFTALLLLRSIVGAALGGTPIAVTLFSEFLPTAGRGPMVLLLQAAWTVGTAGEALLAWAVLPSLGWRWMLALTAVPMLCLLGAYPMLPESPMWLMAQGRVEEAQAVVERVARVNGRPMGTSLRLRRSPTAVREGISSSPPHHPQLPPASRHSSSGTSRLANVLESASSSGGGGSYGPLGGVLGAFSDFSRTVIPAVFGPKVRRTTALLWIIWFVNAITYYGLVLLTTALQSDSRSGSRPRCTADGRPNFSNWDYAAVLVTSAAEAPGLAAAALLFYNGKGRVWCLRAGLLLCAFCISGLLVAPTAAVQLLLLFIARGAIEGTFSTLYVMTPEMYSTRVRSFGVALCNGFSRLGGFAAPFATVFLVESGRAGTAEVLLGTLCLFAAGAAALLPFETKDVDLEVHPLVGETELEPDWHRRVERAADAVEEGAPLIPGRSS